MHRFSLVLLGSGVLVACGGGDGGGGGPRPGSIAVSTGDDQVAPAGTALPESLAVIVRDAAGDPLPGVNVTFAVASGAGQVSPAARVTSAAGISKTRHTLGPNAGTQTVNATAGNLAPAQFSAVSQINGAVNIASNTPGPLTDTVRATKAESLSVLVTDQNTTPVPGITVTWASPNGTVSPGSRATDPSGISRTQFIYGTSAENQTATATVTGLVGSPVTITLIATAGTAVSIHKTVGDNGTAPPSSQVVYTVQTRDTDGNPKGGITVDWAVGTGGGSITPTSQTAPGQNVTGTNGNASATRTLGSSTGTQTATATASGLTGSPATFTTTALIITTVQVADFSFTPQAITIPVNSRVIWAWQGTTSPHNVTFTPATGVPTDIGTRAEGSAFRDFEDAGSFAYHCGIHPQMTGSVTVTP